MQPSRELVCLLLPSRMRILDSDYDHRLEEVQNDDRKMAEEAYQVLVSDRRMRCRNSRRCLHDDRQFSDGTFDLDASAVFACARSHSHAACASSRPGRVRQRADYDQPQPRSV